jgi:hypothetical protein
MIGVEFEGALADTWELTIDWPSTVRFKPELLKKVVIQKLWQRPITEQPSPAFSQTLNFLFSLIKLYAQSWRLWFVHTTMAVTTSQPVTAGSTPSPYQIDVDQVRAIYFVMDFTC